MTANTRNLLLGVLLVGVVLVGLLFVTPGQEASSSTLSAKSSGWLGVRGYLERRGTRVTLSDLPLTQAARSDGDGNASVWVLSFPFQRHVNDDDLEAVQAHLHAGGTVVIAYSKSLEQSQEERVLDALGLAARSVREPPPVIPWRWWSYQQTVWTLTAGDGWGELAGGVKTLRLPAPSQLPEFSQASEVSVLYQVEEDQRQRVYPVVFSYPLQRGRVVVLPAALLSNAYLLGEGHVDFLESLRLWLGDGWTFDEYHHGLTSVAVADERGSTFAWDLFMIHIGLFYGLGLLALVRRFGPVWREGDVVTGSTSSFLRNLGALHLDLRHHQAAARLLAERRRALDPSLPEISVPEIRTPARLVEFAREKFS